MKNKKSKIGLICISLVMVGCSASITSEHIDLGGKSFNDGVVYHMPLRAIRVDLIVAKASSASSATTTTSLVVNPTIHTSANQKSDLTITTGQAQNASSQSQGSSGKTPATNPTYNIVTVSVANNYLTESVPDLEQSFLLHYDKNLFGDNNMAIAVSNFGLLSTTHADTVSKIDQIASNVAIDIASASIGAGVPGITNTTSPLATSPITTPIFTPSVDNSVSFQMNAEDTCPVGNYSVVLSPKDLKDELDKADNKDELDKADNNDTLDVKHISNNVCGINITLGRIFKRNNSSLKDSRKLQCRKNDKSCLGNIEKIYSKINPSNWQFINPQYQDNSFTGLFYKQDLPYEVKVKQLKEPTYQQDCSIPKDAQKKKTFQNVVVIPI